jgi:hypothetical protein
MLGGRNLFWDYGAITPIRVDNGLITKYQNIGYLLIFTC